MVPRGGEEDGRKSNVLRWLWVRLVNYLLGEGTLLFCAYHHACLTLRHGLVARYAITHAQIFEFT